MHFSVILLWLKGEKRKNKKEEASAINFLQLQVNLTEAWKYVSSGRALYSLLYHIRKIGNGVCFQKEQPSQMTWSRTIQNLLSLIKKEKKEEGGQKREKRKIWLPDKVSFPTLAIRNHSSLQAELLSISRPSCLYFKNVWKAACLSRHRGGRLPLQERLNTIAKQTSPLSSNPHSPPKKQFQNWSDLGS